VRAAQRAALFREVPTLKEATSLGWTSGAWRGIAAPKGLPADIQSKLEASVKKAYDSKDYKDFMTQRGFGVLWGNSQEFAKFMAKGDTDMKAVMTAVGIAK
jgi:tripartite-type tricarboxylate transporter receptor subunit TctC